MSQKLEWIFQYRVLLSKTIELHIPLTATEQLCLTRLRAELPAGLPRLDDRDEDTRLAQPLPAEFACSGRFRAARVRNASATGLAIITSEPPPLGEHLLLHVWDPTRSIEYTFPTRVVEPIHDAGATKQYDAAIRGVSVAFEGLPLQTFLMTPRRRLREDDSAVCERIARDHWRSTS